MPHEISFKRAKAFLAQVPWSKVVGKATNAERGQRLFPSQTPNKDSNMNFRLDKGSVVDGEI
jgi:hypothetical protein